MEQKTSKSRVTTLLALLGMAVWLAVFSYARISALKTLPLSQRAAERYAGQSGKRFVQLSAFFHPQEEVGEFDILLYNEFLQEGLKSSGNGGVGFPFACSVSADLAVQSARGMFQIPAIGMGGDFFLFHPYPLLHGSLTEIPAGNGIIVNDGAAWLLFGAVDAVDQPVLIGGNAYKVVGVVRLEDDRASQAALGREESMVFVPYSAMGTGMTCYEVVLPEPVKGYGEALFAGLRVGDTVSNSTRFSASAIWEAIRSLPGYNMDPFSAPVPYWENAARNIEMRIILWTMLLCFFLLPAAAVLLLLLSVPMAGYAQRLLRNRKGNPIITGRKGVTDP